MTRGYIGAIADYIGPFGVFPRPNVYSDEQIMAWILDGLERVKREHVPAVVTGKPPELGGIVARRYATALVVSMCSNSLRGPWEGFPWDARCSPGVW